MSNHFFCGVMSSMIGGRPALALSSINATRPPTTAMRRASAWGPPGVPVIGQTGAFPLTIVTIVTLLQREHRPRYRLNPQLELAKILGNQPVQSHRGDNGCHWLQSPAEDKRISHVFSSSSPH